MTGHAVDIRINVTIRMPLLKTGPLAVISVIFLSFFLSSFLFAFKTLMSMKYILINITMRTVVSNLMLKSRIIIALGLFKHKHFQQKFSLPPP